MVQEVTSREEFQELLQKKRVVVVDFFATWCPPCMNFAPTFSKLASQHGSESVAFVKANVDVALVLAEEYEIEAMPTFKVFRRKADNSIVVEGTMVGAFEEELANLVIKAKAAVAAEEAEE